MIQPSRDDFEVWLADMDDALDRFKGLLPTNIANSLDYSPESLDVLESWILSRYPDHKKMLEPSESRVLDGIARYIGETFRKAIGGYWDIELNNPKDAFFGLPKLTGFSKKANSECPLSLATASASRRTGSFFSTVLKNMKKRYLSNAV